jgi:hypothetical protein
MEREIILDLNLKKEWFDMYLKDIDPKCEDYRDIKPHFENMLIENRICNPITFKKFTHVRFSNGYAPWFIRPHFYRPLIEIKIGIGKSEWGASGKPQFIIKVGYVEKPESI